MLVKHRLWLLGVLGCLSCGGPPPTTVSVEVPVVKPVTVRAVEPRSDGDTPGDTEERLRTAAERALREPVDFSSATRVEINKRFPQAEKVRDLLTGVGAPFSDDDWFGEGWDLPPRWEVSIGEDVDVATAQAVIAACVLGMNERFLVEWMRTDSDFGNRNRIYLGGLDAKKPGGTTPPSMLLKMLDPGISAEALHRLGATDRSDFED